MTISGAVMQGGQALSPDGALYVKLDSGSAITGTTITATTAFNVGDNTVWLTKYAAKQLMISGDGTGATTNAGVIVGYGGSSGVFGLWNSGVTPGATNTVLSSGATTAILGGSVLGTYLDGTSINMRLGSGYTTKFVQTDTAGAGPSITAGTAADNTPRALSISQTWTDGTSSNIGIVGNFDMGATGTATGKLLSLQAGAAGTTEVMSVDYLGAITIGNTLNSVSPTSPNRTITMVVGGVTVYIPAKTTND